MALNQKVKNLSCTGSVLSNVQMELIKLYATNLNNNELMELKSILADHFSRKAIDEADKIWMQKDMSTQTMDDWLNEE